ncbi:histidinolphosphatase [Kappamyces sp. JEL0829]|nr:histidinolphosphatase [Kappamyces sp. JEL0829]
MTISLHSHSGQFCLHGHGDLETAVQRAQELGFTVFGMTEHIVQDLYPEEAHLQPDELAALFDRFHALSSALRDRYSATALRLLVGMEIEWIHSNTLSELQALLDRYPLDYLVGSVHHVDGIPIDFSVELLAKAETQLGGTEQLFQAYFDAQHDMICKVQPKVVGHFDLIRMWRADFALSSAVWDQIKRNVEAILAYGGLVEINSRAWKKNLNSAYPLRDVLGYMRDQGVRFTLSDDSHGPRDVGMYYDLLGPFLAEMGIDAVWIPGTNGSDATRLLVQDLQLEQISHTRPSSLFS